jgi:Histidine phosphatase superfamily (branch 1)
VGSAARLFGSLVFLGWVLAAIAAEPLSSQQLVAELRKGGYILYVRHPSTDSSRNDNDMSSYEDCASQRNLTDTGRDEARAIGAQIKRLGIPIGTVYASPYCRTVETAILAFGRAEKTQDVRGGPVKPDDRKPYDALKKLLATPPARGRNNVVSGHGNPFYLLFGAPHLAEGEIAVIRPGARDGYEVVARIRPADWDSLAP